MSVQQIIGIVVAALVLIGLVVCFLLKKDYIKYSKYFSPIISAICQCVKVISGLWPNNELLKILSIVLFAAVQATKKAEELWLSCLLDKDKRNEYAQKYILDILNSYSIEIDENIQKIIDGAISFVCYLLPHGLEPTETYSSELLSYEPIKKED